MTYAADLQAALREEFAPYWLRFMPNWSRQRRTNWRGKGAVPNALTLHHTAAASTTSTNPNHPGNQKGADEGVVRFIQTHYDVPAASFTLMRWGGIVIHSAYPIWHAGVGSFRGKAPWNALGIPDNLGNDYMLGVEIMSKGLSKDYTEAQKDSLVRLIRACSVASGWGSTSLIRRPQHRDWTTRKIDIRYSNAEVTSWLRTYGK